jgi:hypothetical protein
MRLAQQHQTYRYNLSDPHGWSLDSMSEQRPQSAPLFRTSLRSWQANYKARQAQVEPSEPEQPAATPPPAPMRVKRLAPHKRRAMRKAANRN